MNKMIHEGDIKQDSPLRDRPPPDVHSRTVPANDERSRKVSKTGRQVALGFLYTRGSIDGSWGDSDLIANGWYLGRMSMCWVFSKIYQIEESFENIK